MKRITKCLSAILMVCMSTFGLPVYASVAPEAVKSVLSDEALAKAVGGNYEARIVTHSHGNGEVPVQALLINHLGTAPDGSMGNVGCSANYRFEALNSSDIVVQTFATGTLPAGQTRLVTGYLSAANNVVPHMLRATVVCGGNSAVRAETTSRRIN